MKRPQTVLIKCHPIYHDCPLQLTSPANYNTQGIELPTVSIYRVSALYPFTFIIMTARIGLFPYIIYVYYCIVYTISQYSICIYSPLNSSRYFDTSCSTRKQSFVIIEWL